MTRMPKGDCGCRNHLGKPKVKYPSTGEALSAIFNRHVSHGPHSMYPCPSMPGVWHVRSNRRKH